MKNRMTLRNQYFLLLGIFVLLWLVVYWNVLSSMVDVWGSSETYKHCFFILPIVLYLFYERRKELTCIELRPNYWLLIVLFAAQGLFLLSTLLGINFFSHVSAYLSLVTLVWCILGNKFVKSFLFPLFFLAFAIPFGEELVPWLQDITAYLTVELVQAVGIPIYREGLYLFVPNGTFLVAEACAGIRFLIASFALGTLFAYLNYKTKWKVLAFVGASLIVPIIANGIRAFGIVVIGYSTDMEHATGADHLVYGWFFFAFVLLLLFGIGQIGQEDTRPSKDALENVTPYSIALPKFIVLGTIAFLLLPIYQYSLLLVDRAELTSSLSSDVEKAFPLSQVQNGYNWLPQIDNADEIWSGVIEGNEVFIAQFNYDSAQHELVSGQHRYYNIDIWTRKSFSTASIAKGKVNQVELANVRGDLINLYYWFNVDGQSTAGALLTKLNQTKSKLAGRAGKGYFIAVKTDDLAVVDDINTIVAGD